MTATTYVPRRMRPVETDSPSLARCNCVGLAFFPRHHSAAYAKWQAKRGKKAAA